MADAKPRKRSIFHRFRHLLPTEPHNREELMSSLRCAQEREIIDSESLTMIEGVLQVSQMKVRDVMIPRGKMVTINSDAKLDDVLPIIVEAQHSRYPVLAENHEDIIGILLAKDLLNSMVHRDKGFDCRKIMRPTVFIPESKRLNILLNDFRRTHNHMAIVVDEYGSTSGLITIEDVLEQIVGEIEDESDIDENEYHIKELAPNQYTVNALTPVEEFNNFFKCEFSDQEFDTIGGLVLQEFGHLPKRGENVIIDPFRFKVLHADNRRIRLLKVTQMRKPTLD